MPNEEVTEKSPLFARNHFHKDGLDLDRIVRAHETKALGEARHVGIDDNALVDVKGVTEDNVRRFSSHPCQCGQLLHRLRHIAAVMLDECPATALKALRFI